MAKTLFDYSTSVLLSFLFILINTDSLYADSKQEKEKSNENLLFIDRNLKITSYGPLSNVLSIRQHGNYLWFGTSSGLVRYDIYTQERKIYRKEDGLADNIINDLIFSKDGSLWAATSQGISLQNEEDKFTTIKIEGLSPCSVNCIAQDSTGGLWFGTEWCIASYKNNQWNIYSAMNCGMASKFIRELQFDNKGNLWISSASSLTKFDGSKWINYGLSTNFSSFSILPLDNSIYVGGADGLYHYNNDSWKKYPQISGFAMNSALSMYYINNKLAYIGLPNGLYRLIMGLDYNPLTLYKTDVSNKVNGICRDNSGKIWLATAGGVYYEDSESWKKIELDNGMPSEKITNLIIKGGNIFYSVKSGAFRLRDYIAEKLYWKDGDPLTTIYKFIEIDDQIFICADGQLGQIDGNIVTPLISLKNSPMTGQISSVLFNKESWYFAGKNGVCRYSSGKWEIIAPDLEATDILFYGDNLFIASTSGLWLVSKNGLTQCMNEYTNLNCLSLDDKGMLWVGALDGIYCFKDEPKNFWSDLARDRAIRKPRAVKIPWLSGESILKIITPKNRQLIFLSSNYAYFFDANILDPFSDDLTRSVSGRKIEKKDREKYFYKLEASEACTDENENLWLASFEGIIRKYEKLK